MISHSVRRSFTSLNSHTHNAMLPEARVPHTVISRQAGEWHWCEGGQIATAINQWNNSRKTLLMSARLGRFGRFGRHRRQTPVICSGNFRSAFFFAVVVADRFGRWHAPCAFPSRRHGRHLIGNFEFIFVAADNKCVLIILCERRRGRDGWAWMCATKEANQ